MDSAPDTSLGPKSQTKHHHPYFTPAEVELLSEKQRGKLSVTQEERVRQQACTFIEALGSRVGFPRKTIATAQNLYHRFHLFFPRKDFGYHDVALAALFVSTKMHDTLKKPRELLMISYGIRFPELAAKSKNLGGEVDMDPTTVEHDRQRLLAVERLILETICFNFTSRQPFPYVIKLGKALKGPKWLTRLAWRLAIDCHRTLLPIQYPPHTIALGCLFVAALLSSLPQLSVSSSPVFESNFIPEVGRDNDRQEKGERTAQAIAAILGEHGVWELNYQARVKDLEDIAHGMLDLLMSAAQSVPSANTSPSTPASPSSYPQRHQPNFYPNVHVPWKHDQLMRLKIDLREREHPPRERPPLALASSASTGSMSAGNWSLGAGVESADAVGDVGLLGKNEGTVRFLFGPE